jgi:hypothetical protein
VRSSVDVLSNRGVRSSVATRAAATARRRYGAAMRNTASVFELAAATYTLRPSGLTAAPRANARH